jgi:hypothetical protein
MDQKTTDLLICAIDYDGDVKELIKLFSERFPRIAIKAANGIMTTITELGGDDYRVVVFVTTGNHLGAAQHLVNCLSRTPLPASNTFVYVHDTADAARNLRPPENRFVRGQENEMLAALEKALPFPAHKET